MILCFFTKMFGVSLIHPTANNYPGIYYLRQSLMIFFGLGGGGGAVVYPQWLMAFLLTVGGVIKLWPW